MEKQLLQALVHHVSIPREQYEHDDEPTTTANAWVVMDGAPYVTVDGCCANATGSATIV